MPDHRPHASQIRSVRSEDLLGIVELNNVAAPAVNRVGLADMLILLRWSVWSAIADGDRGIDAFALALGPGEPYQSENYRFFERRYDDFVYVDRIVVAPHAQGQGIGRRLYDDLATATSPPVLACEVNLRPRNDASLEFHKRLGFQEVGRQETTAGAKEVALLVKRLVPSEDRPPLG